MGSVEEGETQVSPLMGGDVMSERLFSPSKLFDHVFHFSHLIRVYLKVDILSD